MCCICDVCACVREREDVVETSGLLPLTRGSAPVVKTTGAHPQVRGSRPTEVTSRAFPIHTRVVFPACASRRGPLRRPCATQPLTHRALAHAHTRAHTLTHTHTHSARAHAHTHVHTQTARAHARTYTHTHTARAHTRTHTRGRPTNRPGHPSRGTDTRELRVFKLSEAAHTR